MESLKSKTNKSTQKLIYNGAFAAVSAVLSLIFLFLEVDLSGENVFLTADAFVYDSDFTPIVCLAFIALFAFSLLTSAIAVGMLLKNRRAYVWPALSAGTCSVATLVLNSSYEVIESDILLILALVVEAVWLVFGFYSWVTDNDYKKPKRSDFTPLKSILSAISGICFVLCASLLYVPLCYYDGIDTDGFLAPMSAVSAGENAVLCMVFLAVICAVIVAMLKLVANAFKALPKTDADFVRATSPIATVTLITTAVYFVSSAFICSLNNSPEEEYTTTAYIPLLIALVLYLVFSFVTRNVGDIRLKSAGEKAALATRIEFLVYAVAAAGFTVAEIFSDIIKVEFNQNSILSMNDVHLNGYKIFMTYNSLESGFQLIAFVLFAALCIIVSLIVASVVCLVRRSKLFYKVTLYSLVSSGVISLIVGLFGKYYEIVQRLNEDAIKELLGITKLNAQFDFKVTGTAFYWFLAVAAILVVAIIRRPYSKGTVGETPVLQSGAGAVVGNGVPLNGQPLGGAEKKGYNVMEESVLSNPCPAFSEIDGKIPEFNALAEVRSRAAFEAPTLKSITEFVVSYARDSRLHLSYSVEDIATFIAGLGATRLTILQGMSGTGKTSLPKIFSEAVFGNCEIVEVESSWRDKNELLGFYNEFSKSYTPKKFTQSLYRAALNKDTITFIVLDEMNLSRIEYYFSDFLSLMENEQDKREIKLLNIPLYKTQNGVVNEYAALQDGHTIKIPSNIWFIGTANRDESTFEISDKVYDRAHTMNFNKRASKPVYYGAPIEKRYLSVAVFKKLLDDAKAKIHFSIDSYPVIKEVEALLAPYNISFGNRIANQIEDFVSIYASCFESPESVIFDAVEKIMLSKVISKLELKSVENKVALAGEFEKLNMKRAAEFILKLNED